MQRETACVERLERSQPIEFSSNLQANLSTTTRHCARANLGSFYRAIPATMQCLGGRLSMWLLTIETAGVEFSNNQLPRILALRRFQ